MKSLSLITIFVLSIIAFSCEEQEISIEYPCLEGEVIGKIRSAGGGLAVSLTTPIDGSVSWQDRDDVIELLNIPVDYTVEGTIIYFSAREAREGERGPITTDGDESIKMVLYGKDFSDESCSEIN